MARLTRLLLVLGSMAGFSTANPAPTQAGVIPWVYDAIFGPVGSLRYGSGSGYAAGYPSYSSYSSFYAPVTTAYAPTMASAGGCSTCSQAAYYPSTAYSSYYSDPYASYGGSGCSCSGGNCAGGNCASGNCSSGNCANGNCAGSNTVGYPTPTPDRSFTSNDTTHRLNELEHTQRQILEFLKREYPDSFEVKPSTSNKTYSGNEGFGDGDTVKPRDPRPQERSINSESPSPYKDEQGGNYIQPRKRPAPANEVEKPTITPPPTEEEKTDEAEPKTTRLDIQITRRAVAPRERISSSTQSKGTVAKSNPNRAKGWLDSSVSGKLARQ